MSVPESPSETDIESSLDDERLEVTGMDVSYEPELKGPHLFVQTDSNHLVHDLKSSRKPLFSRLKE